MSKSLWGVVLVAVFGSSPLVLADDDCCLKRLCRDSDCDDCCEKKCRKSIGIGCRIPSIRWGISIDCCDDGCRDCRDCKKCCHWWSRLEPPRAPVVFSVPAVTVPQQALAVQPQLAPMVVPHAAPPCEPKGLSETDKLVLELLLSQAQAAGHSSAAQTPKAPAASALDPATEARLTELENRLDRILRLLEN